MSQELKDAGDELISIVVPVYNEELNIEKFVERLTGVMDNSGYRYELLLVNDGSIDRTWKKIQEQSSHPQIKGLSLSRNFGHQNALFAGLHRCEGDAIISMDGDLQHPPELLPKLIEEWKAGNKIVSTKRLDAEETGFFKRVTSALFYRVFSKLSGIDMQAGNSDFRLIDRQVLSHVKDIGDNELFLRGITAWVGFKSSTVEYQAENRFAGESKYNLSKMIKFSSAAITSFSIIPLKFGIWLGFFTSLVAIAEIIYILFTYFSGGTVAGWASVMTFMSIMFSVLFFMIGLIGVYLGGISEMLKRRPRFIIDETTEK